MRPQRGHAGLTTLWHGLACWGRDYCKPQGTEGFGILSLIHAADYLWLRLQLSMEMS